MGTHVTDTTYGQWRTGLRALTHVFGLRFNHDKVFEAVLAFGFPTFQREYRKLRESPEGRRLLEDKPDLMALLGDDDYLATLPQGSLGAAYRDFLRMHRLDAGVFDAADVIQPIVERNGWDPDFGYMIHRGTVLHDVFHVLGGYGPDLGGEIGNLGFTHGQLGNCRTTAAFGVIACTIVGGGSWQRKRQYWNEAVDRGRAAKILMAAPYEELLARPLSEVRELLQVEPASTAHPDGHFYSPSQLPVGGDADPFEPWDYEASLASPDDRMPTSGPTTV